MKIFVSYKSYLWNFKGYEPPIYTNLSSKIIDLPTEKLTEDSINEIKQKIEKEESVEYKKLTPVGSTEVVLLGITKLDEDVE